MAFSFSRFLDHIQRSTTLGRTPLDEWSARRRDIYLTTHNTENRLPCSGGIRTSNPSKRGAADPRLRPRGRWDRHSESFRFIKFLLKLKVTQFITTRVKLRAASPPPTVVYRTGQATSVIQVDHATGCTRRAQTSNGFCITSRWRSRPASQCNYARLRRDIWKGHVVALW